MYPKYLDVKVTTGKKATIARVEFMDMADRNGNILEAIGEAYCHPSDKFDDTTGEDLALGRALVSLGKKMIKSAESHVAMVDHNRTHSRAARAARKAEAEDRAAAKGKHPSSSDYPVLEKAEDLTIKKIKPAYAAPHAVQQAISRA